MSTLPLAFAKSGWYTSYFIAKRIGVSLRTVQHWCRTGQLTKMGYVVAMIRDRQDRRYWIRIPPERRNAMFKRVLENPIDTLSVRTVICQREGTIPISGATSLC